MDGAATFGLWLKQRRKARDLTQEQLADLAGCAAETIRKIEGDRRRPSREMADRLAQVLQVPTAERSALIHWARTQSDRASLKQPAAVASTATPDSLRAPVPVLKTKLYTPRPRSKLVPRARLFARLDAGAVGRLTLVAAPPGFGKTTLIADWLTERERTVEGTTLPVAWLALDMGDNDPSLFLRYLIAALQTITPMVGQLALRLLETNHGAQAETTLPLLLDDLVRLPERSILILDDYHVIEALPVHTALAFLLDHMPPQLHMVIISRADPPLPLARMRVRREITELRATDLRFTSAEATTFLCDVMRVALSPHDVAALEARTEGWVAGLQLAALSLQERPPEQIAAFVRTFTGSHHFVVDYLVDEVLARQPAHLHTFLFQTAILDRLCGSLCDAVRGIGEQESGMRSEEVLAELGRRNLFLVPLDDERRWYRYHHLFADVLRERVLRQAAVPELELLHRRASWWLAKHGLGAEAMRHALAAHDWEQAAQLVEEASGAAVLGNMQKHQTLGVWIDAIPEEVVRARPRLCLLCARLAMLTDIEQAARWVWYAEQAAEAAGTDGDVANLRGEIMALRAGIAASRGEAAEAIGLAQQALTDLSQANLGVRGEVMEYLARAHLFRRDAAGAADAFAQMAHLARTAGDHIATFVPESNLAYLQRLQGKLSLATLTCRATLAAATDQGVDAAPDTSRVLAALADLLRERNDLDAALAYASDAVVRSKQLASPNLSLLCSLVLARVHQARGDVAQALTILSAMRNTATQFRVMPLQALLVAFEAQLHLQQGDLAAALALVGAKEPAPVDSYWISPILIVYSYEHLAIARAQTLLAYGRATGDQRQLREVLGLLEQHERAEREGLLWLRIKLLALQALVADALGDRPQALRILRPTVELAALEGLQRVLLDEGAPLQALLAQSATPGAQDGQARVALEEPLTPREMEILQLLAAGRSTQAIGQELVVAVGTVKRHIANILSKLEVESRLAAVARARKLGLL